MGRTTLPGAVEGHVHAFRVLCGLPRGRIRYDNLRTAVERMLGLSSRAREEHAGGRPSARTGASTPSPAAPASRERTRRAGRLCGSPTRRRWPSSPTPVDRPPRGRHSQQRPALTFSLWADKLCGISPETACRAGPGSPGGLPDGVQCVSPCASFREGGACGVARRTAYGCSAMAGPAGQSMPSMIRKSRSTPSGRATSAF